MNKVDKKVDFMGHMQVYCGTPQGMCSSLSIAVLTLFAVLIVAAMVGRIYSSSGDPPLVLNVCRVGLSESCVRQQVHQPHTVARRVRSGGSRIKRFKADLAGEECSQLQLVVHVQAFKDDIPGVCL